MNESGEIVKKLVDYFKISLDNLLVIHDDTDIRLGEFKIQKNRGAAGHKGLESIINCLKSKDFWRLRIGVRSPKVIHQKAEEIVLKNSLEKNDGLFSKSNRSFLERFCNGFNKLKCNSGYLVNSLYY